MCDTQEKVTIIQGKDVTNIENKERKKKKKKNRCAIQNCNQRVVELIGDCKWCKNKFCQTHRLPETHACSGLRECKQQAFDTNANSLNKMKCVGSKIQNVG